MNEEELDYIDVWKHTSLFVDDYKDAAYISLSAINDNAVLIEVLKDGKRNQMIYYTDNSKYLFDEIYPALLDNTEVSGDGKFNSLNKNTKAAMLVIIEKALKLGWKFEG